MHFSSCTIYNELHRSSISAIKYIQLVSLFEIFYNFEIVFFVSDLWQNSKCNIILLESWQVGNVSLTLENLWRRRKVLLSLSFSLTTFLRQSPYKKREVFCQFYCFLSSASTKMTTKKSQSQTFLQIMVSGGKTSWGGP